MVRNGGAARDLMRNLSEINRRFETKFACLNILESQRKSIESLGVEVLCPAEQWKIEGGIWNEISAKQDRSSKRAWEDLDGIEQAVQWADAIHLTTGAGSMDFVSLVPDSKPLTSISWSPSRGYLTMSTTLIPMELVYGERN